MSSRVSLLSVPLYTVLNGNALPALPTIPASKSPTLLRLRYVSTDRSPAEVPAILLA